MIVPYKIGFNVITFQSKSVLGRLFKRWIGL